MAKIFITGSSSGLGFLAGQYLLARGHEVVLHARDQARSIEIRRALPEVGGVVIGDFERLSEMRAVAAQVNELGAFDAVIHNVGVGENGTARRTEDKLPMVFAVNALAPYVLTALMRRPERLVYLSSSMHVGARADHPRRFWRDGAWRGAMDYSQSKFMDTLLAFAVARRWSSVRSNAVDPGWAPTRMGGPSAPDDLDEGYRTQAWLAEGTESATMVSGKYFHRQRIAHADPATHDERLQDDFLALCAEISGIDFPSEWISERG